MRVIGWAYWTLAARIRDTIDDVAVHWILKRNTLPREYVEAMLLVLAGRMGAKVEMTQTPGMP